MQRLNFTLDDATVQLLDRLAEKYYHGNKSLTVRSALEWLGRHRLHSDRGRGAGELPYVRRHAPGG
jgi:hypothetical protein